jgi:hypothetical protein
MVSISAETDFPEVLSGFLEVPFFEEKATQHQGWADASLFFHGLKARLPAFKPKLIVVVIL